ncbi:unnamed protein product [Symbiodinium sp. CCMP2592]|nr:unnamed protein product [Symbiodinium sp. CCMP2592]
MQLITFQDRTIGKAKHLLWASLSLLLLFRHEALHGYQEAQLLSAGLRYIPSSPAFGLAALQRELAAVADPQQPAGRSLAHRALSLLGRRACPAPARCGSAMLVASGWAAEEPGQALLGDLGGRFAMPCSADASSQKPELDAINVSLVLKAELCSGLVLLDAVGSDPPERA